MNTIETVQAAIDALEASAPLRWRDEAKHDAVRAKHSSATAGLRSLLAQMQTEPIKAGSLDDALYSPDGSFGGAQSPAPVAVQPAALRMLTEDEVEAAWNEATRNYRRRSSDSGLKLTHADSEDWHEAIAIQRAFAAANNLPLSASPEDKP